MLPNKQIVLNFCMMPPVGVFSAKKIMEITEIPIKTIYRCLKEYEAEGIIFRHRYRIDGFTVWSKNQNYKNQLKNVESKHNTQASANKIWSILAIPKSLKEIVEKSGLCKYTCIRYLKFFTDEGWIVRSKEYHNKRYPVFYNRKQEITPDFERIVIWTQKKSK